MKKIKTIYLILLFSFLIRLISANQSLWLDEAIQSWSATNFSLSNLLTQYMSSDFNPPLLHILLWFWVRIFGSSEFSLRFISILAGTGVVYFSYRILKTLLPDNNKNTKELINIGTILISICPLLVYYSQEARPYILASFFVIWSMFEFLQILKKDSQNKFNLKYFLSTSFMFFSHYIAWFIFPTQIIILLLVSQNKKEFFSKLKQIISPLISLILLIPILIPQLKQALGVQNNLPVWQNLSQFSLRQLALIPTKILIGRLPIDLNLKSAVFIGTLLFIWAYIIFRKIDFKKFGRFIKENSEFTFLSSWLLIPILIGIIVSFKLSLFSYFRFLYVAPAFYLLFIYSLKKLSPQKFLIFLTPFILVSTISTSLYLSNNNYHRENWKETVGYINKLDYSTKVIILSKVNKPFEYYDHGKSELYDYNQIEDIRFEKYIWLIKYAQPIFDPENETENKLETYGFTSIKEKNFRGDITVKLMFNPYSIIASKN